MDAILMCGGRGTRLDADREKPLVPVGGTPMVERVRRALAGSDAETVHAVVSPHAPATREFLEGRPATVVEAPGEGYVPDLERALDRVGRPALTVAADLPLLAPAVVDGVLAAATTDGPAGAGGLPGPDESAGADGATREAASLAVCVPAVLKRRLGASVDDAFEREGRKLVPAGCNVVAAGPDAVRVSYDARLAVNANRPADLDLARALAE